MKTVDPILDKDLIDQGIGWTMETQVRRRGQKRPERVLSRQLAPEAGVCRDLLHHGDHRTVILTVIILAINVVATQENPDSYCHDFH
jgi:hypothetical protein